MQQLVIIHRDGVINERTPSGVLTTEQFNPLPGSLEAIARLNHAGVRVAVATHQPATPEGLLPIESINRIHAHLQQLLARRGGHIDAFFIEADGENDLYETATGHATAMETIFDRFSTTPEQTVVMLDESGDFRKGMAAGTTRFVIAAGDSTDPDTDRGKNHFEDLMSATDFLLRS